LFESVHHESHINLKMSSLIAALCSEGGVGDWMKIFNNIFLHPGAPKSDVWDKLDKKVVDAYSRETCFPAPENVFRALRLCGLDQVRVVIIGQDPYHGVGRADGLAFSVPVGVKVPPSLRNILQERADDLQLPPRNSDLSDLAADGVLLLNSVMTVSAGRAASHKNLGWEEVTLELIRAINMRKENVCFVLWGAYAQKYKAEINESKHFVHVSPHPSPLSSYRGFFGSKPFSKVNSSLELFSLMPINW
jgi:uracil-DNA glycosylase